MKTETLKQAIEYVLSNSKVQEYINKMENLPNQFVIAQISAGVTNYQKNIIRVFINFNERGNPNNFKEDAIIDIQGTAFGDFKIVGMLPYQQ